MSVLLLEAHGLEQSYSNRKLFHIPSLRVYAGDRIGLTGVNGSGKSTLLHLLAGTLPPEGGTVIRRASVPYLRQFGGADTSQADARTLCHYGVRDKQAGDPASGGETTRLKIASVLGQAADQGSVLFLLDEPTANLDEDGVRLFSRDLGRLNSFVLVSHDRGLLDSFCTKIWELCDGTLSVYEGGYSGYREQKQRRLRQDTAAYEQYAAEKKRLTSALSEREGKARNLRKTPKRMGNSEARLHRRAATEKQEKIQGAKKSMETRLDKLKVMQKPREPDIIRLDFSLTDPPANRDVIRAENLSFGYDGALLFDKTSFVVPNGSKTALRGGNGSGKTTLLGLMARGYPGIHTAPKAKIGYFYQGFENLDMNKTVLDNVMADSVQTETLVRTVLARLLIKKDDVHKKTGVLSGGERVKLSFAKLYVSGCNVLLLDEPTNYLDIASLEVLQSLLTEYEGTVVFVSHDRVFAEKVAGRTWDIRDKQIEISQK